jgi:hypothetical protein
VLFATGRWRPALLVVGGYLGLTLWAALYQDRAVADLLADWYRLAGAGKGGVAAEAYASVGNLFGQLGLERWTGYGSLFVLLGSGAWVYRHRTIDIWLLIGVVALVARFWTYHRWYDDLILLLPLVTLCRLAKWGPSIAERRVATPPGRFHPGEPPGARWALSPAGTVERAVSGNAVHGLGPRIGVPRANRIPGELETISATARLKTAVITLPGAGPFPLSRAVP